MRVSMGLTVSRQKFFFLPSTVNNADWYRKKISRYFKLAFFPISADRHSLLAPEEYSSKMENQFPCSQKHSF